MALIDQAHLEKHLQIVFDNQPDPVVDALIAQAQGTADRYCRQPLEHTAAVVDTFEVDQPEAWHVLSRFPVTAVASVVEDGTALTDPDDYRIYANGRIRRVSGVEEASWSANVDGVVVTFAAGYGTGATAPYDTIPDDLILAITTICGDLFRYGAQYAAQGAVPIKSVQLDGSDTIIYAVDSASDQRQPGQLSPAVKALLAPYVRRPM